MNELRPIGFDARGKLISPCMNCSERSVNCHSSCFEYIFYRERLKQYKQERCDYWAENGYSRADIEKRNRLKTIYLKRRKAKGKY